MIALKNVNLHITEDMLMTSFLCLFSPDHLEQFTNYLNSKHRSIKFSYEKESNNSLPFLDILISSS